MRKSLGKIFIFILVSFELSASTYLWKSFTPKKEVYVNEVIYLKHVCEFSDRGELYTIGLKPTYNAKNYNLTLIKKQDTFVNSKRMSSYEYLAKAKVKGNLAISFGASMKETTLDSIVYSSGSRDDDRGDEEFKEKVLSLSLPSITVMPSNSDLVGEFSINISQDKAQVKAYEPYHLDVEILGNGNLDDLKAIRLKIDGVKIFTQEPLIDVEHTKDGIKGSWHQKFAFVSEKDFTIPQISIEYFDLKSQMIKKLESKSTQIKVTQAYKKEDLLDEDEESLYDTFATNTQSFVYYVLTFISGFLLAKINFKRKKLDSKNEVFNQKIQKTNSLDELSMLLILSDERKFSELLLEFESKNTISLAQAKRKVLKFMEKE